MQAHPLGGPARMCEMLVGLSDVDLVGINDSGEGAGPSRRAGREQQRPWR